MKSTIRLLSLLILLVRMFGRSNLINILSIRFFTTTVTILGVDD